MTQAKPGITEIRRADGSPTDGNKAAANTMAEYYLTTAQPPHEGWRGPRRMEDMRALSYIEVGGLNLTKQLPSGSLALGGLKDKGGTHSRQNPRVSRAGLLIARFPARVPWKAILSNQSR
ncbi:unnamed protein product [Echinostoma caproni]|uniref:Lipoprotein n=1 Tax=Echinostoma caproni TaxID=27848 RepID=A0A183BGM6_9TREM|nr:unnamed protein product [Echinostoma caproni]